MFLKAFGYFSLLREWNNRVCAKKLLILSVFLEREILFVPGNLPFCIVTVMLFHKGDSIKFGYISFEKGDNFPVSDGVDSGSIFSVFFEKLYDFFDESSGKHLLNTMID